MPYKRRVPVSESEMDITRWEGHHSVCQTIRDIYHLTDNIEVKMKCRLAMARTKSMHEKLKEYKAIYGKNLSQEYNNSELEEGN